MIHFTEVVSLLVSDASSDMVLFVAAAVSWFFNSRKYAAYAGSVWKFTSRRKGLTYQVDSIIYPRHENQKTLHEVTQSV